MDFRNYAEEKKLELIRDLQGCIRIPSVYAEDDSGFPYGKEVHQCLEYVLQTAERMGFSTSNMDEQAGWCEYGQGEEMIAVLCHLDVVPAGDGWSVPPTKVWCLTAGSMGAALWMTKDRPWLPFMGRPPSEIPASP